MALIKCPDCAREISDDARTCPQCGRHAKLDWGKTIKTFMALTLVIGAGAIAQSEGSVWGFIILGAVSLFVISALMVSLTNW